MTQMAAIIDCYPADIHPNPAGGEGAKGLFFPLERVIDLKHGLSAFLDHAPLGMRLDEIEPADQKKEEEDREQVKVVFNELFHGRAEELDGTGHQEETGPSTQERGQYKFRDIDEEDPGRNGEQLVRNRGESRNGDRPDLVALKVLMDSHNLLMRDPSRKQGPASQISDEVSKESSRHRANRRHGGQPHPPFRIAQGKR